MTVAHGSALTILSISFERYYVICKPLKAGYKLTRMRAFVVICCLWLFALLVTSPVMLMTKYYYTQYHDGSLVPVCSTIVNDFWGTLYYVVITICCFILPLLILIMLYTVIVRKLITRPSPVRARVAANNKTRTRHQVVLMIGMVVLFFFITLLPFRIFVLWIVLDSTAPSNTLNMESYYNILYFCRIMCYINSTINPIIYNMTSTKFRQAFLRVLDVRKGGSRHQLSRQWTLTATLPSVNSSITFRAIERSCSSHVSRPSLTPNGDL